VESGEGIEKNPGVLKDPARHVGKGGELRANRGFRARSLLLGAAGIYSSARTGVKRRFQNIACNGDYADGHRVWQGQILRRDR